MSIVHIHNTQYLTTRTWVFSSWAKDPCERMEFENNEQRMKRNRNLVRSADSFSHFYKFNIESSSMNRKERLKSLLEISDVDEMRCVRSVNAMLIKRDLEGILSLMKFYLYTIVWWIVRKFIKYQDCNQLVSLEPSWISNHTTIIWYWQFKYEEYHLNGQLINWNNNDKWE